MAHGDTVHKINESRSQAEVPQMLNIQLAQLQWYRAIHY